MPSRKLVVLVAAVLMALMVMMTSVMPAFAEGRGPSACSELQGYQGREFFALDAGSFSGEFNPGGITLGITPLVPTGGFFCNPTFTE